MLCYPSEVPVLFSLVWSSDGFDVALTIGALGVATLLTLLALRDRRRRPPRVAPVQLVPRSRDPQFPRAAA